MAAAPDDERVSQGIDHLQNAAKELIAAARSFLDVLEDVVDDQNALRDAASVVGSVVESAVRAARHPDDPFGGGGRGGVEHVPVD